MGAKGLPFMDDLTWYEDMTKCNRQHESCKQRIATKPDVRGFDAVGRALHIFATPSLALAGVSFAPGVPNLALAVPNLAPAVPDLVRVVLQHFRAERDRALDVGRSVHVVVCLVLSAERLSLFAGRPVLSVVHLDPFAEHLALVWISRDLISRVICLPATVGGIC